ncbi:MAG: hypothetical protein QNJ12_07220 [Ilumatobacter sp.]|uniref:hypothetical protein n=1 Tax=Ilumatobacter sp. TaxID=1967498 RepID=UPI00261F60CC|nr:hypothetical protein [Ilumatobacter sp.]MDJ0768568.1 hypothetical protein [Ilumatobacter sp.]
MSESIAEMILPGTYIEVRSEGLISAGAIATGNIGIVGTAARGPRNEVRAIGSYAEALDLFGAYDSFVSPNVAGSPLTLTRALEQAFRGGARSVYAVRIAAGDPSAATLDLLTDGGTAAFTLTAVDEGSWGDLITVKIVDEGAPGAANWKLSLSYRNVTETFEGADVAAVHAAMATSSLVTVGAVSNGTSGFATLDPAQPLAGGADEPVVSSIDVGAGLAVLEDQPVQLVLVAGFGSSAVRGVVAGHLERTENEGNERIAVLGVADAGTSTDVSAPLAEATAIADDRVVLVGPGLVTTDAAARAVVDLPASYLAAVVAGRLATVAPHVSLTNKTLAVDNITPHYTSTAYKNLLQNRMLLVRRKFGFQVVKGITTDTGAFKQISIRRIVDFAKAGVRQSSDPYIGRLNNSRVRSALQATLDGFLSQMVLDEMLVSYELSVTATRQQEIRGIAQVTMTLLPTFSIDFVRVTMNLQ